MKIITGNTGEKHVTSEDDGTLYASIVGKEDYILDMNDNFSHEVLDANTIKISSGDALLNGRQVRIPKGSYDLVSIDNGQTGYKRIDLIVIRYESNKVIEKANLVVIKGTSTTGNPTTPEYQKESILDGALIHDVPLYKVHLNGINLETVEKVFVARDLSVTNLGYRPNLLINSDFRNPINQRGEAKYSPKGNFACYTIDRWFIFPSLNDGEGHTLTVNNGYITFANTNENMSAFFGYYLEKKLSGTFTISVKIKETTKALSLNYRDNGKIYNAMTLNKGLNKVTITCESLDYIRINMSSSASVDIEWIKLEQGTVATPFAPRLYAEELALCQRYYLPLPINYSGFTGSNGILYLNFDLSAMNMRAIPKLVNVEKISFVYGGNLYTYDIASTDMSNTLNRGYALIGYSGQSSHTHKALVGYFHTRPYLDAEIY